MTPAATMHAPPAKAIMLSVQTIELTTTVQKAEAVAEEAKNLSISFLKLNHLNKVVFFVLFVTRVSGKFIADY